MNYFMGIDTGTQGVRIGVYDKNGNCAVSGDCNWETKYPEIGWAEQDPDSWWAAILSVLEEISAKVSQDIRHRIQTVCVDATSTTMFAVNKDGEPLHNALMWMDIRSKTESEYINNTKHWVLDYCGGAVSPEWFSPKMLWCKKHMPEIYQKSYLFVEQLDWVNFKLCGKWTTSICNRVCKGNYIESKDGYNLEFFREIGLEEWQDKVIQKVDKIGTPIGIIRPEISKMFDLNPNITVVQGGIDAHIGMFGTNAISNGRLSVIMGTSFVHLGLVDKYIDMKGIWGPYENAVLDNTWCVEGGQATAAALINWFVSNFNICADNPFEYLANTIDEIKPGSEGLVVLDNFQGNRTPYKDSDATGLIYGLRLKHTWKHIYHAILEGICYGTRNIIENFDSQGYHVNEIVACGGVTKNKPFLQMISDITGKKIVVNKDPQGSVLGGAVIGAAYNSFNKNFFDACESMVHPINEVEPNMKNYEIYHDIFSEYKNLYFSTKNNIFGFKK